MIVILFLLIIFLILFLPFFMVGWAHKRGRRGWVWGWGTFMIVFGIPFGGLPLNYANQGYHCDRDGGITIYKTLEQWKQENPGVAETLNPDPALSQSAYFERKFLHRKYYRLPDRSQLIAYYDVVKKHMYTEMIRPDGSKVNWLNQRFIEEREVKRLWFDVARIEERIVDQKTHEVMANYINYDGKSFRVQESWFVIPLWTGRPSCERGDNYFERKMFNSYTSSVRNIRMSKKPSWLTPWSVGMSLRER